MLNIIRLKTSIVLLIGLITWFYYPDYLRCSPGTIDVVDIFECFKVTSQVALYRFAFIMAISSIIIGLVPIHMFIKEKKI